MTQIHQLVYLFSTVLIFACGHPEKADSQEEAQSAGWRLVYQHDESGNQLQGDLDVLIQGIRNGYAMEVGWGWVLPRADSTLRLEHRTTPNFITIMQDKIVSAILPAHPMLSSYFDPAGHAFEEAGSRWQAVVTTQGNFNAQLRHPSDGHLLKEWPQQHRISWFLEYPKETSNPNNPLYD